MAARIRGGGGEQAVAATADNRHRAGHRAVCSEYRALIVWAAPSTLKGMGLVETSRMDKSVLSVASLTDPSDEQEYWQSRTPQERLAALELMRQICYGYDPATTRLQRVLEITQREPG